MKPGRVYGDVETFTGLPGAKPLDKFGSYRYASDPSTGFNSAVLAWDGQRMLFDYEMVQGGPASFLAQWLRHFLNNTDYKFVFHYSLFELAMFKCKLGIIIPPDRVIDTFAKLGYHGYPRGLDDGAKATGCSTLKDLVGKGVMLELAKGGMTPADKPKEFQDLYHYNAVDVQATIELDEKLPDLPPEIQSQWEVAAEINMRGFPIDLRAVENALVLKEVLKKQADEKMAAITGGNVTTVGQIDRIQAYAAANGVHMVDCTGDTVRRTLAQDYIPDRVRSMLELRQEAGLTSLGKYEQMKTRHVNGRLYHEFDTFGCVSLRPKGGGVQALNLARSDQADRLGRMISEGPDLIPLMFDKPMQVLKEGIRGTIEAPPGMVFVGGDLGQIEARCTGWTAQDEAYLTLFRDTSRDPYCEYGRILWGQPITKADLIKRTAAKASVLQMGFGGGIGAYQRGSEQYDIDMSALARLILPTANPMEMKDAHYSYWQNYMADHPMKPLTEPQGMAADILKQRFRKDFKVIAEYWHELWNAFLNGGQAGMIYVEKKGNLRILHLPSGRCMFYHDVRQVHGEWTYLARNKRKKLWYGVIIENVAQAMNHDISSWYKGIANANIGRVVHECYDEFTMEIMKHLEGWAKGQLALLVKDQPDWTKKPNVLPIVFDIWSGPRYG